MKKLKILPLGGLGEIGMNCLVLEHGDDMVLMDCGIQFPDARFPGVDLLLPDLRYVLERKKKLRGVVVTHGHDDHIGAIPFLAKSVSVNVFCTPFPEGLLANKIREVPDAKEVKVHTVTPRKPFKLGCFVFDPIPVQHSIIESLGYGIETPVGNLIHTGDFKHDESEMGGPVNDFQGFEEWGKKGVLLLFSDSTNAERTGHTISEEDVVKAFDGVFRNQEGRLFVALFASNIKRIENLLHLAKSIGKKVAFEGRSMHNYVQLAHEQRSIKLPEDTLIPLERLSEFEDRNVIILLTGSQAEPQSALVRVAQGVHRIVKIKPTDRIFLSSRFIPGNERAITAMIDQLYRAGAEVTYESIHHIHVSGHGQQDELLMMLKATRPKFFIPVHGEYRHLAMHSKLAKSVGVKKTQIIEDGQMVEVTEDKMELGEKIEIQKGIVLETSIMDGTPSIFHQRTTLSKTGAVFVSIVRREKDLRLAAPPRVGLCGVLMPHGEDRDHAIEEIEDLLKARYRALLKEEVFEEAVRLEVRRFFKKRSVIKPTVITLVLDV